MQIEVLEEIKSTIEKMNKIHHIEILKIIKKNQLVVINENKSGVYINLTFLPESTLIEMQNYIHYIRDQENVLIPMESQKDFLKNTFFVNDESTDEFEENQSTKGIRDYDISIYSY
jgi:hypothetical protein